MKRFFETLRVWRNQGKVRPWLYLPLAFCSYGILDWALRLVYKSYGVWRFLHPIPNLGTIAWALILVGIACVLPGIAKKLFFGVTILLFILLTITHGVLRNLFRRFFMFSTLAFAGDGAAFADSSYIKLDAPILVAVIVSLLLMLAAIVLAPRKGEGKRPQTMGVGLLCCLVGLGILGLVHQIWLTPNKTLAWDNYSNPAAVYDSFTDSTSALLMLGLYQYTFRDVSLSLGNQAEMGEEEAQKLEEFCETRRASKTNNEMTGVFEGKNLIMIQLEAIDTWMLSSEYMPNLWKIKQESMVFANHYTPAYITAGTLNTEIMANTGLIPATGNVSTKVYMRNQYPYSIANQMRKAGYTAESFHGSEGNVYNRGIIHPALGYEQYHSGSDMKMENYTMDHDMMSAYSDIIRDAPFYSFIITYSGHGPYSAQNPIYLAHAEEARAVAKRDEGNYVNAVAHAMETDAFIKAFIARMEEDGSLDDTALVFYADHYNYYMMNDQLNMDIKGVDDLNLLQHTDFFIYSKDMEARTISKVTSSLDILPTLANLFGLEDEDAVYIGNDAFSDAGGYVFFTDGSWYDGETYWTHDGAMTEKARIRSKEISTSFLMSNMIFKSDYFAREHD